MKKKRISGSDLLFHTGNYLFFTIFTILCVYPFYYILINTISDNTMSANGLIRFLPAHIHLDNYRQILKLDGLISAAAVTLGRTVIGTICTVLASAFLGFMLSQEKMWKRKFCYRFFVATMYFNAGLIPLYLTMKNLHLLNNFLVYIVPAIVQPFNIILVKTYTESIPKSLQEAAEIDGAGFLKIFWKIMLPVSKPILATIAIFSAVGQWNSFQDTLIYVTNKELFTLQYLLYTYINQANSLATMIKNNTSGTSLNMASLMNQQTPTSIRMTVTAVVVIPILLVYPMFQKYFVKGIMIGSVKG
ncbi:MAG: carbohydrate ABC transporter permease [Lachnospiraceae bacterium]|nr:carbohydrate ABC transporter permease [Lachnospiraceae bacterium]